MWGGNPLLGSAGRPSMRWAAALPPRVMGLIAARVDLVHAGGSREAVAAAVGRRLASFPAAP
eukprot:4947098-Lingulodinium_polyedra.AAC.1